MVSFNSSVFPASVPPPVRQKISSNAASRLITSCVPSPDRFSSFFSHTESRSTKCVGTFRLFTGSPRRTSSAILSASSPSIPPSARTDAIGGFALAAATISSNPTTEISLPGCISLRFNSSYSPSAVSSLTQNTASSPGFRSKNAETISLFCLVSVPSI